jgi:hypothetical protein
MSAVDFEVKLNRSFWRWIEGDVEFKASLLSYFCFSFWCPVFASRNYCYNYNVISVLEVSTIFFSRGVVHSSCRLRAKVVLFSGFITTGADFVTIMLRW